MAWRVFLLLTAACFVFLWKPITSGEWYAAGDVSGLSSVLREPGIERGTLPQIDVTVDFLPWTKFNEEQIGSGRLPLWNPYNNSGAPHLANIQTAVFSPFMAPFYVFSMRIALIVSAYLILVTAGMSMYGLLRHLRASHLAGIAAALTYMFSGYMVLWLRWPLAAVGAFVPGMLWASSALVRTDGWRRIVRRGCALGLLVGLAIFAGHPETMFFGILPSVVFCTGWLLVHKRGLTDALRRFSRLVIAGLGGLAFGAIQLLPFTEYLLQSSAVAGRQVHEFQSLRWASAHTFPLAAGSPTMEYEGPYNLVRVFHEITILYVGVFALLLAVIAVVWAWRSRRWSILLFGGMSVAVIAYMYDVLGIGTMISALPLFSLVMPSRLAIVWAFGIGILAGFGIDALDGLRAEHPLPRRWFGIGIAMVCGVVGVLVYRSWHQYHYATFRSAEQRSVAWQTLVQHVGFVVVSLFIGLVLVVLFFRLERATHRRLASFGIVAVLFAQSGFLLRGQNVSVPEDRFMNVHPRVDTIVEEIGENQTLWTRDARLMPEVNLWIPAYSPDNYDVIGVETYDPLYRKALGAPERLVVGGVTLGLLMGPYAPPDLQRLQTMGIRRVVTDEQYPFTTYVFPDLGSSESDAEEADFRFEWFFGPPRELVMNTDGVADDSRFEVLLNGSGLAGPTRVTVTVRGSVGLAHLPDGLPRGGAIEMTVPPAPDGSAPAVTSDQIADARLLATVVPGLELDDSIDGFQVFRVPGVSGFGHSPATATFVSDNEAALERVLAPGFEPGEEVVLEGGDGSSTPMEAETEGSSGDVVTAHPEPGVFNMSVSRSEPGYVVLNQNFFPGWQATVDGEQVPVVRANSTFMAVPVPAGTSTVTFRYRPASVRWGAGLTLGTLIGAAALYGASLARRRRRDRGEAPTSSRDRGEAPASSWDR